MNLDLKELELLKGSRDVLFLRDLLSDLKKIALNYYGNGKFLEEYAQYVKKLYHYRLKMVPTYLCDVSVEYQVVSKKDILNYLVFCFHQYVIEAFEGKYKSVNQIDFTNACVFGSCYIRDLCRELGIECEVKVIYPGYLEEARLFHGSGYHYFNIVTIETKKYLVDVTYKQFFKQSHGYEEEIGVPLMCAPLAGYFMLLTKERRKVASSLLKNGWIAMEGDVLKHYCDGFTLSFRNGFYYDYFDEVGYETGYSSDDYQLFLSKKGSQLDYEPLSCLGPMKCLCKKYGFFK